MDKDFMEEMLNQHITKCNHCGKSRNKLSFKDLPTEIKKQFGETKDIEYCLYCPHCDDYSVISGGGSSFDNDINERPIKTKSISLNAPCSCGSGKKYKRCCGKV